MLRGERSDIFVSYTGISPVSHFNTVKVFMEKSIKNIVFFCRKERKEKNVVLFSGDNPDIIPPEMSIYMTVNR